MITKQGGVILHEKNLKGFLSTQLKIPPWPLVLDLVNGNYRVLSSPLRLNEQFLWHVYAILLTI